MIHQYRFVEVSLLIDTGFFMGIAETIQTSEWHPLAIYANNSSLSIYRSEVLLTLYL